MLGPDDFEMQIQQEEIEKLKEAMNKEGGN